MNACACSGKTGAGAYDTSCSIHKLSHMQIQVGKPVTGSNLIGREQELRELEQCIAMGQSVALIAPRRYGKTSLLLESLRRSKQQNLFSFYLDLFSIPDLYDLAAEISKGVLSNQKLDFSIHQLKHQITDLMQNLNRSQPKSLASRTGIRITPNCWLSKHCFTVSSLEKRIVPFRNC